MMKRLRVVLATVALTGTLLAGTPAAAQESEPGIVPLMENQVNVLLTVRVGKLEEGRRVPMKTYTLVVAEASSGSKLLSGSRVPIPTASREGAGEDTELTSFVYQNVGFSVEARAWVGKKGQIKLVANIEDSRVQGGSGEEPPTVETRELSVNTILSDGVPLEVTRVEGASDPQGFVEVEAKILR